jgi:hypothetical protein
MATSPAYYRVQFTRTFDHPNQPSLTMKTSPSVLTLMAAALLLIAAPVLRAGPLPDLQNRMRPTVRQPAKTDTTTKPDANTVPVLCAQMQNCGCAAMAAKKAKS